MTKYYQLVAIDHENNSHILFGDYDRATVEQERRDERDSDDGQEWKSFKVYTTNDTRIAADQLLASLNPDHVSPLGAQYNKEEDAPMTREEWLTYAAEIITDDIITPTMGAEWVAPTVRLSVGFLSNRATKAIAVCYPRSASTDGVNEIFVSPTKSNSADILASVVHELIHAADDCASGHRNHFARVARAVGLEGKLTATYAGATLKARLETIVELIGQDIPHAALLTSRAKPKQATRMIKVSCVEYDCGFTFRATRSNINKMPTSDAGLDANCPCCSAKLIEQS